MANKAANVTTGKPKIAGAVFRAPLNTPLPTDAATELADGFTGLGYVSDDGVVNANSLDSSEVKAWGGSVVITMHGDSADTFRLTLIEALNPEVLKVYHGDDNVSGTLTSGITVKANAKEMGSYVWVIDMILRGDVAKRLVIPNGTVSDRGDITYKDDEVVGYNVTIKAQPDSNGNTHYEYIKGASST